MFFHSAPVLNSDWSEGVDMFSFTIHRFILYLLALACSWNHIKCFSQCITANLFILSFIINCCNVLYSRFRCVITPAVLCCFTAGCHVASALSCSTCRMCKKWIRTVYLFIMILDFQQSGMSIFQNIIKRGNLLRQL